MPYMRKAEIVQLALIILGLSLIIRTLISLMEQISMFTRYSDDFSGIYSWIFAAAAILIILILLKSNKFSIWLEKKINK